MSLTNRELAEHPELFAIASHLCVCSQCNYIESHFKIQNSKVPCPQCGRSGLPRCIFPSISAIKLLEMVAYFYAQGCQRVDNLQDKLVKDVQEQLGNSYPLQTIINTTNELHEFYEKNYYKSQDKEDSYNEILEIIQNRLALQSKDDSQKVFAKIMSYSGLVDEHTAVVMMATTLLEALLNELLVTIYTSNGIKWSEAKEKVSIPMPLRQRCDEFKEHTTIKFKDAVNQCSILNFYGDWDKVRKARNDFVHKTPFAINSKIMEKAFDLSKNATTVFHQLQNRYGIKRT